MKKLFTLLILTSIHVQAIESIVLKHSKHFNLDPQLVLSIIQVESNFNNNAVSYTKDFGLMQINERTAKAFGFSIARIRKDSDYAIYCGTFYLSYLRSKYSSTDNHWWARYHSSTPVHKQKYIRRILNVYKIKGNQASPRRYYSNKRIYHSQWVGPIFIDGQYHIAMGN